MSPSLRPLPKLQHEPAACCPPHRRRSNRYRGLMVFCPPVAAAAIPRAVATADSAEIIVRMRGKTVKRPNGLCAGNAARIGQSRRLRRRALTPGHSTFKML